MSVLDFKSYQGRYTGCNPDLVGEAAERRIAQLEESLEALVAHDQAMIEAGIMRHFVELEKAQDVLRKGNSKIEE